MSKTISQAMSYEVTKPKVNNKAVVKAAVRQAGDLMLIGELLVRHKVGLLAVGNMILVLNWMVPAWPEIIKSLF